MTTTPLYCSNIQLHKFFRVEAAEKILLAIKAADKRDKLGYQVCVCVFFFHRRPAVRVTCSPTKYLL